VPATIQSRIFCLPHMLSKNLKIKIYRTIILPLLSIVNPDPEIRSCRRVEIALILTPPPQLFQEIKKSIIQYCPRWLQ